MNVQTIDHALNALFYSACMMLVVLFFLFLIGIMLRAMDPTEPMTVETAEEFRARTAQRGHGKA